MTEVSEKHVPVDGWFEDDENPGDYTTGCVVCRHAWPCEVAIERGELHGAVEVGSQR